MTDKHTQGPWQAVKRMSGRYEIRPSSPAIGWTIGFAPLARVDGDKRLTDAESNAANAMLMAAAPDLLTALQEVVAISDRKHDAWDKAHAAIAKALGHNVM